MSPPLRAGIIGLGVGWQHALAYEGHPLSEVVALCDLDSSKRDVAAQHFSDALVTDDAQQLLESPDIDIISIASYDDVHTQQVLSAIDHGKHVFVEKPMCLTVKELHAIREKLDSTPSISLSSNMPLRTAPRFAQLREAVRNGGLGTIYHMAGDYLWGRPQKLKEGWRPEMDFYSIILGGAIHIIDLLTWITGQRPASVMAMGNAIATQGSQLRYNDFASLQIRFTDTAVASVTVHGGCVHPHHHRLAIYGDKGSFIQDSQSALWFESCSPEDSPREDSLAYPAKTNRKEVIHSYLEHLNEPTRAPLVTAQETFDVTAICLAAERSAATGQEVPIDYV